LNETEKEVSGVVFTPRWSDVVWVNANSIAVLVAYCFPGEFADSGQEVLGGFGLEILESYAVDLPQGFMAWMAVVGNEDVQNRRLPAALGAICASDINNTDSRILSPQEQQEINNVISQFTTIQNTQITNIDQVTNVINNVTEPTTTKGQPLRAEIIIANTTRIAINNSTVYKFDADVTGGVPPYNYHWQWIDPYVHPLTGGFDRGFSAFLQLVGTHTFILNVTDSKNQTASDSIQITVRERPQGGLLGEGVLDNATVQGEGITTEEPMEEEEQGVVSPLQPPTATEQGDTTGEGEEGELPTEESTEEEPDEGEGNAREDTGGTPAPSSTTEQEPPSSPGDDTGGGG
jgi:hypothetical protein